MKLWLTDIAGFAYAANLLSELSTVSRRNAQSAKMSINRIIAPLAAIYLIQFG